MQDVSVDQRRQSIQDLYPLTPQERVRRAITWLRVPLMLLGTAVLVALIHDRAAFWWGVPCVIAGELVQVWASSHLSKNTVFTVSGPYSHVRNPMYIGRFTLMLGLFVMTGIVPLVLAYVVLFAWYAQVRVKREERRLQRIFAPDYQQYCSAVKRWLPRLQPYSGAAARYARWSQACVNNEHWNLLAVAALLALIYARIQMLPEVAWRFL